MRSAAASLIALFFAFAQPVLACTPPTGWPQKVKLNVPLAARTLADAAATIDIVVAERATDDYEVGTDPEANAEARASYAAGDDGVKLTAAEASARLKADEFPEGARIHYRVVERLKGDSADTFTLNGMTPAGHPPLGSFRPKDTLPLLRARLNSQDLSEWPGFGACIQPLWTGLGHRYVVFRDPRGRLLRQTVAISFEGERNAVRGPVYAEVRTSDDDAWLKAIRQALATRSVSDKTASSEPR